MGWAPSRVTVLLWLRAHCPEARSSLLLLVTSILQMGKLRLGATGLHCLRAELAPWPRGSFQAGGSLGWAARVSEQGPAADQCVRDVIGRGS